MGKYLSFCSLLLLCVVISGCAGRQHPAEHEKENAVLHAEAMALEKQRAEAADMLLSKAREAIGTPYVRGGTRPGGFDCSGLVLWAYKSVGVTLPRTAREQSRVGEHITDVSEMRPGDIVAFRHPKRGYHTGIYVGDGKFIHSPRRRKTVRINRLSDSYFSQTFLGARRVNLEGGENLVAQAQSRLTDYAEEKAVRELSRKDSSKKQSSAQARKNRKKSEAHKRGVEKKKAVAERRKQQRKVEKNRAGKRRAEARKLQSPSRKQQPAARQQKKNRSDVAQRRNTQKQRKQRAS
ncbi:MAG: C40 family peptidase [Desulfovibrio sp.]|nr:C40 family peptidase [Desulfovibrio sp.]